MSSLKNKKVIIIGDRDGIPGLAIEECVKTIEGTEIVFSSEVDDKIISDLIKSVGFTPTTVENV